MATHGISWLPGSILRKLPPRLDWWDPERSTGSLILDFQTLPGRFVSPGTGRLTLTTNAAGEEIVAQDAETRNGQPVIPGSGIKGAVRTLFEILSFSCDPFDRTCSTQACCQACAVFGLAGWSGRVSFEDAVPAGPEEVRSGVDEIPTPFPPHAGKTGGHFRLYDLEAATEVVKGTGQKRTRDEDLSRVTYTGRFRTRMSFWNLQEEELGRLLLAMGLGFDEATRFPVRLGGVKYHGQGAVEISPQRLSLVTPNRTALDGEPCRERCRQWISVARASGWAQDFLPQLERLAQVFSGKATS